MLYVILLETIYYLKFVETNLLKIAQLLRLEMLN